MFKGVGLPKAGAPFDYARASKTSQSDVGLRHSLRVCRVQVCFKDIYICIYM